MTEPKLGALTALGAYLVLVVGMGTMGLALQSQPQFGPVPGIVGGLWGTEAIAIALPALFVLLLMGIRPATYLGFRGLSWKHVLVVVIAAAANQPVVSFLTWCAQHLVPPDWLADFDEKQRLLDLFFRRNARDMMICVTVAAPLGEEIFFRGLLLPGLRKSWGIWPAVLVSGALFSAIHVDKVGFLGLMEIGILLAALRIWTGSLWGAILGHALNNGIAGFAFLQGWEDPELPPPPAVLILGAIFTLIGIALLVRLLRKEWSAEEQPMPARPAPALALGVCWAAVLVWSIHWMLPRFGRG
jgi:hypothetical protein